MRDEASCHSLVERREFKSSSSASLMMIICTSRVCFLHIARVMSAICRWSRTPLLRASGSV